MIDLRLAVGIFFVLVGALLSGYGAIHEELVEGIPLNLYWGLFLLTFGLLMSFFGYRGQRRTLRMPETPAMMSPPGRSQSAVA